MSSRALAPSSLVAFVWRALREQGVAEPGLKAATAEVLARAQPLPAAPLPRLYALARAYAIEVDRGAHRRRRKREVLPPRRELDASPVESARLCALARAVRLLPPRQRDVFLLAEVEGVGTAQIAACVGVRAARVDRRLVAACASIAGRMAERTAFVGSAAPRPSTLDEQTKRDLALLAQRAAPPADFAATLGATPIARHPQASSPLANKRLLQAGAASLAIAALVVLGAGLAQGSQAGTQAEQDPTPTAPAAHSQIRAPSRSGRPPTMASPTMASPSEGLAPIPQPAAQP